MLTIQERWRFESIPNQLVIYTLEEVNLCLGFLWYLLLILVGNIVYIVLLVYESLLSALIYCNRLE